MSAKLPLIIDNPTSTGVVRYELHGDRVKAKSHLHEARKVLGALKQIHGVNSNPAQDGSGFFSRIVDLEDGTRITATTNSGQDVVSIKSPPDELLEEPAEKEPESVPEGTRNFTPFLWVGAKYISGGGISDGSGRADEGRVTLIHLCVWEPKEPEGNDGAEGSEKYNIVSNRHLFTDRFDGTTEAEEAGVYGPGIFSDEVKSDIYPLGPSISQNLEVWTHQSIVPNLRIPGGFIDIKTGDYETIIRSRRTEDSTSVLDVSGAGSVVARSGKYFVKAVIGMSFYRYDWINVTPMEYEIRVVVGASGSDDRIDKKVTVIFEKYTSWLCDLIPKGWHPYLKPVNFVDAEDCASNAYWIDDFGPTVHEPWWQSGFDVSMPSVQTQVPISAFLTPFAKTPAILIPPVGFDNTKYNASRFMIPPVWDTAIWKIVPPIDISVPRVWLPRSYRAPASDLGTTVTLYRLILFTTTLSGGIVFSGTQVKRTGADGCDTSESIPGILTIPTDPGTSALYGAGIWAGTYTAMDDSPELRTITLNPKTSPGNGVNIWNEGNCFGGTGYTIFQAPTTGSPPGGTTRLYAKYTIGYDTLDVVNGAEYGVGQVESDFSIASSSVDIGKAEFLLGGGIEGYVCLSTIPYLTSCHRDMDVT